MRLSVRQFRRFDASVFLALLIVATACMSALGDSPDSRLAGYRTPPGWKVAIAAAEPLVVNPVSMTFDADGRLYVTEWMAGRGPNDHIKVLTDTDGDGTFDKSDMYMDHLELPAGILFWDGWTYITLDHDVVRFKDKDGDGKFETREVIASGFGNDDSHHRVSGMIIGPDGWLYLTTGDSDAHAKGSDGSIAKVLRCGGVFRCRPDGSRMENVAFGMRNPWGNVSFDDEFRIFHTDNDNEGSPGFTGCRLLHVVDGGDYGWRLREGARCCAPDFERATWNGGRPGRLGYLAETGRGAPAGLCVLNSAALPPSAHNLLVYPDVFRKKVRAYKLEPAGATFHVTQEFELLASDEGLFRPDDAEVGPDGALYILDWRTDSGGAGQLNGNGKTGRIYRMTWAGTNAEPARKTFRHDRFANVSRSGDAKLVTALKSDDYGMRRAASLELIRRGLKDPSPLARLMADPDTPPAARRHAVAIASTLEPARAREIWLSGLRDRDRSVRRIALELATRSLAETRRETDEKAFAGLLDTIAEDPLISAFVAATSRTDEVARTKLNAPIARALALLVGTAASTLGNNDAYAQGPFFARLIQGEKRSRLDAALTERLLNLAARDRNADPVLRDGLTRAIETLGASGLSAVLSTLKDDDNRVREAALFTLQGWRGVNAVDTLVAEATSDDQMPASDRAGLFRAVRELVPAVPPDRIAEWLARETKADPEPRVEAIHVLTALHERALLAASPVLPALLADPSESVRRAALGLAAGIRSNEIKTALMVLMTAPGRSIDERRLALAALRGYQDRSLASSLTELFARSNDGGFQVELLRTLAPIDFAAAADRATKLLSSNNREVRQEAIALLGQKPDTALAVARLYNDGKLPADDLPRVIEAVRTHATPEIQAAMQVLLKNKLLAAPTGAEARRLRQYVARQGNPSRGKALYLDAKKTACTTCHRMEGVGGSVGPDLTRVWETLSFDKRVESILEPSREIKEGFGTFKVATNDGRVVTGLLLADTADGVTLKDAQGREVRIAAKEVEEKGADKNSLMPAGVVGNLSFSELADLLAFLGDRAAQESMRPRK